MSNKSFKVASIALLIAGIISGCSSSVTPSTASISGSTNFSDSNLVTRISENVTQSKQDSNHFYIDAGKGQITGASLTVKLNLGNGGFNTKAIANGAGAKITSDITSFDVALIDSASSPNNIPATPAGFGTVTKTIATAGVASADGTPRTLGSGNIYTTITFTNVPESTNKYWVAVAAKAGAVNITNLAGTLTNTTEPGAMTAGKYYVSTTGGGATAGSMIVTRSVLSGRALYQVESTTDLAVALTLADATTGATIGSVVTVNDGTTDITGGVTAN